jgi:HK97 family phage major capsid protein
MENHWGEHVGDVLEEILGEIKPERTGSRYLGPNADKDLAAHVAKGGTVEDIKVAPRSFGAKGYGRGDFARSLKALAEGTGSSGGFLVPTQYASEILAQLRARSAINRLGPTVVSVEKELDLTSLSSGATAYWTAENAPIVTSEQTFAQSALLRPKMLAALTPVSQRLLRDAEANPSVEEALKRDLAEVLALRFDLAAIQGGGGTEPTGLRTFPGTTAGPSLGTNGRPITYDDLIDMVASLRALNAPFQNPSWLFNGRLIQSLQKLKDASGRYLADSGLLTFERTGGNGTLMGFPFVTSGQIPVNVTTGSSTDTTYVLFGSDWQELWIAENDTMRIETSNEASYLDNADGLWKSAFQNSQTLFKITYVADVAPRRPSLWTVTSGVRP